LGRPGAARQKNNARSRVVLAPVLRGPEWQVKGPATVLAFDFGTRRIGVAVGTTITRSARPLTTIDAPDGDARSAALARVIEEWQPDLLVVGLPVHADGTPHAMTQRARRFGEALGMRFAIPVAYADERHTSELASTALAGRGREGRGKRDEAAAQMILQGWLDDNAAA
jgi:putative Holliday junction resolvase